MNPGVSGLLAAAAAAGFRIELSGGVPRAFPDVPGAVMPADVLPGLKEHRRAVIRHLLLAGLKQRAAGRGKLLWGYYSECGRVEAFCDRKSRPEEWNRAAVEGDDCWTFLPLC